MEANEKMVSEEVLETAEEMVTTSSGKGLKVAAGIGLVVLAGVLAYKYVAKPVIAKIKAKKEAEIAHVNVVEADADDLEEEQEEL